MGIIIGIDISKKTTDWCVLHDTDKPHVFKIHNTDKAIASAIAEVISRYNVSAADLMLCAEYTNIYWYPLARACERMGVYLWMENAYNISLQTRRKREKNDSADAYQIAMYAKRFGDEAQPYKAKPANIMLLRQLIALQEDCDRTAATYKGRISDVDGFLQGDILEVSKEVWGSIRAEAVSKSKQLEEKISLLIKSDEVMKHQDELLQSIPGVGPKVSHMMLAHTACFTTFANARKFCTQAGVATFRRTSGTSIDSGDHVSRRCDHRVKRNIHLAARSAATVCKSGPLREYYERKLSEGKPKLSALNAVCAKLITIMFAVIRTGTPFDPKHTYTPSKI